MFGQDYRQVKFLRGEYDVVKKALISTRNQQMEQGLDTSTPDNLLIAITKKGPDQQIRLDTVQFKALVDAMATYCDEFLPGDLRAQESAIKEFTYRIAGTPSHKGEVIWNTNRLQGRNSCQKER